MIYTERFLNEIEDLKTNGNFYNFNLRNEVESRMMEIGEEATDEQLTIFAELDNTDDDDLYYTHIHALAETLNIK